MRWFLIHSYFLKSTERERERGEGEREREGKKKARDEETGKSTRRDHKRHSRATGVRAIIVEGFGW